jgi:peroxiredoxin
MATLRLGDIAPDFREQQWEINFMNGRFMVCFVFILPISRPFVLLNWELCKLLSEFEKRNTKVIALSVDGLESHIKWIKDIETQNVTLQYPIIADESKTVANLYDMIHPMQMKPLLFGLFL